MVLSYNEEGERAECWPLDRVLGQPHDLFYPPDEIAAGRPGADLAAALHEGTLEREAWRVCENGAEYLARLTITALFEGEPHRSSDERRVGNESVRTCRSRWSPDT